MIEVNINTSENRVNTEVLTDDKNLDVKVNKDLRSYNQLSDKPKINGVELVGNKTTEDLHIEGGLVDDVKVNNQSVVTNKIANIDLTPYAKTEDLPTKTSDLENDSGFITKSVNNLENYTKTSELGDLALKDNVNYETEVTNKPDLTTKVNVSDVINDVNHTDVDKPLSANMGKELNDRIESLSARGRFLSNWNSTTGLPTTNPINSGTYEYRTGDYYIVSVVGITNYKPSGSSYTIDVPSTTVETSTVMVGDTYRYDGTNWILEINTERTTTFGNISGQPTDNSNLASALNGKVGFTDYANSTTAGVIKVSEDYWVTLSGAKKIMSMNVPYNTYQSGSEYNVISKGTLENVITGKGLIDSTKVKNEYSSTSGDTYDVSFINGEVLDTMEYKSNKVTSISSSSTDFQYPSAKCVYDLVGNVESVLETLISGTGV